MKRPVKLAVMAGILVFFIAATLILNAVNDKKAAAEMTDFSVFSLSEEDTVLFGWEYGGDAMTFERSGDAWCYMDDSSFPLDSIKITQAVEALEDVIAHKGFEPEEELSEYGLEAPQWRISCTTSDGTVTVLSIGDETDLDGYRYFSTGDGRIYLVDSSLTESFSYTLNGLAEQELLPTMTDTKSMLVNCSGLFYCISCGDKHNEDSAEDTDIYLLSYPEDSSFAPLELDSERADEFVRTVTYNLFWQNTASWKASREDLSDFGLDEDAMEVTVEYYSSEKVDTGMVADDGGPIYDTEYNEETFRLLLGIGTDGIYYGMIPGSEMIYIISSSTYTTLSSMNPDSLVSES